MKIFQRFVQILWWLALAYLPVLMLDIANDFNRVIGCPARGECYQRGWGEVAALEFLAGAVAVFAWPACLWFLGGRWLCCLFGFVQRPQQSCQPKPPSAEI